MMVTKTHYPPCIPTTAAVKVSSITRVVPATNRQKMSSSRELPMPNITRISSLSQAHATLLHCWMKLSRFIRESAATSQNRRAIDEERRYFQQWLNQWEAAFTAFLSAAVASMAVEDIAQSRILKTNHLACTILASDPDAAGYDAFESEFQAIVELAGAVLRARHQSPSTPSNGPATPLQGLDVLEPLKVLLARSRQEPLRSRARELLARSYPGEAA